MAKTAFTIVLTIATLAIALAVAPVHAQSQSQSFVLRPAVIDSAGGPSVSAGHRLDGSLGQGAVVGSSASPHFIVQSGYWGIFGSTVTPVVLAANKTPSMEGAVDLSWSGNNASYDLYRAAGCATVFAGTFATSSNNAYTDASPPASPLTCYNVLAVAPGPVPPAGAPAP